MIVQKLKMYNFRCFSSFEIVFSNKINILLGRNATGKTSILEAINYLALTKSFRTNCEAQLVKEQQNEMSVIGEIIKDKSTCFCKIIRQVKGKQVSKDGYKYSKISEYLGEILVVSFTNSDMLNLLGTIRERRKILARKITSFFPFTSTPWSLRFSTKPIPSVMCPISFPFSLTIVFTAPIILAAGDNSSMF